MIKKQQIVIKKTASVKKDIKRERQLSKMLQKKQQLAKAKELAFNLNPIKINWKVRLLKKAVFKYHDLTTCLFSRILDINSVVQGFEWIWIHHIYIVFKLYIRILNC